MRYVGLVGMLLFLGLGWIMPSSSLAQDEPYPVITAENAKNIQQIGVMGGDQGRIAVSPDNHWMAIGGLQGVWIFDLDAGDETAQLLTGHTDTVNSVVFHPESNILASGSDDGTVRLWDMTSFAEIRTIEISESSVFGLDFDKSGAFLSVATRPFVYIVAVDIGEIVQTLDDVVSGVRRVEFLDDSPLLLGATLNNSLAVWDLNKNEFVGEITRSFNGGVRSISTSPDGLQVVIGLFSGRVLLNTMATGEQLVLDYHLGGVRDVQYSPDGNIVASVGMDNKVLLMSARSGNLLSQFELADFGYSLEFSSDSRLVYVASADGKVTTWDITREQMIEDRELSFPTVRQVVYSPNGRQVAAVTDEDNLARVFDVSTNRQIGVLSGYEGRTFSIAYRPTGNLIVTAGSGGDVLVWRADNFELADTLSTNEDRIYSVVFTPDTNVIATGGERFIRLWNLPEKEEILAINHGTTVWSLAVSPDGSLVGASGGLWNAFLREKLDVVIDEFASVAFSPNSDYLATTDGLIPVEPNRIRRPRNGYVGLNNTRIAFSPDGLLVAMAVDETIEIFDVETQTLIATIRGHERDIRSLSFSPDGTRLVSGGYDATIRQWAVVSDMPVTNPIQKKGLQINSMPSNIAPPELTSTSLTSTNVEQLQTNVLRQAINNVVDIDTSPDGSHAVVASLDGVFYLNLNDLTRSPTALLPNNPAIYPSGLAVDYSQDGKMIAVSHGFARNEDAVGGGITIWDVSTSIPVFVTEFAIAGDRGFAIALSNNNAFVAIGFNTPTVRILNIADGRQISQSQTSLFGRISGLSFNADNTVLSASDVTGNKAFFETVSGDLITGFNSGVVEPMQWSSNGQYLYSAEQGGFVLRDGFSAGVLEEYNYPVEVVGDILTTDITNGQLVIATEDTVWFLDYQTGEVTQTLTGFNSVLTTAEVTPNGQKLIGVTNDNRLRVWDIQSGLQLLESELGYTDPQITTAISDDGRFVAIANRGVGVRIFFGQTGGFLRDIDTTETDTLYFLPSSTLIATAGQAGTIEIWDASTGRRLDLLFTTDNRIIYISDNGDYVVTRNSDRTLTVYNIRTGAVVFDTFRAHLTRFNDVEIFGDLIATAGDDGVVKLWDLDDLEQEALWYAHQAGVKALAFAPIETLLATIGSDGINVYDYRPFSNVTQRFVLSLKVNNVNGLYFSRDGNLLFAHVDDTLHVWSMDNGSKLANYDIANTSSQLTTDGQAIMIAKPDGSIYRFEVADTADE